MEQLNTFQQIFIGTYTPKDGQSRGIYSVRLNMEDGSFTEPEVAAETPNPTFLALHSTRRFLYALGESGMVNGKAGGALVAFSLADGQLSHLNTEATGGGSVTHVAVDATGQLAIVVAYTAGEISAFPITADGSLGGRTSFIKPSGQLGPNVKRQDNPHPHSVTISPDNRHAYVCDLGLDTIFCFRLDLADTSLVPAGEFAAAPGAGPRHSCFSPDGKFLYVINELDSTITVYACDVVSGALTPGPSISTLPQDFGGESICAEVRISNDGRFVYGSNRGHDSLAVFARNAESGELSLIEIVPSGGGHPRNFTLSPDGAWLVCANRDSGNVVAFRVDPAKGTLTQVEAEPALVPQGVCVLFVP